MIQTTKAEEKTNKQNYSLLTLRSNAHKISWEKGVGFKVPPSPIPEHSSPSTPWAPELSSPFALSVTLTFRLPPLTPCGARLWAAASVSVFFNRISSIQGSPCPTTGRPSSGSPNYLLKRKIKRGFTGLKQTNKRSYCSFTEEVSRGSRTENGNIYSLCRNPPLTHPCWGPPLTYL